MSQLVKAVMATDTGQRKTFQDDSFSPLFRDVFNQKEIISEVRDANFYISKVYKIGVTLGNEVVVSELDVVSRRNDDALQEAIDRTKRGIIEAVFGEFREDFYRIESAIYDRDFQKARSLLTKFQQKMYGID